MLNNKSVVRCRLIHFCLPYFLNEKIPIAQECYSSMMIHKEDFIKIQHYIRIFCNTIYLYITFPFSIF